MGLNDWALVSRIRYAAVWTGVNALTYVGLMAAFGSLSTRGLRLAIPWVLIAFLVHGWIWYPRAKKRLTARHG
jgi:hypothetical protein